MLVRNQLHIAMIVQGKSNACQARAHSDSQDRNAEFQNTWRETGPKAWRARDPTISMTRSGKKLRLGSEGVCVK